VPTDSSDAERSITGPEFDAALLRAEQVLRQADDGRRSLARYSFAVLLGWCTSALLVGAVWAGSDAGIVGGGLLLLAAALANAVFSWRVGTTTVASLKGAVRRDERFAAETVGLLREVLPFLARDEAWSVFRVQEAKLRIGRFPIRGGRP